MLGIPELNSDYFTTTALILNLMREDSWARRQLRSGIKDISGASKLMKSLTIVGVVFINTLAIPELDGRFHHNHCSNPESDSVRLSGLPPATQWYKGHLCGIKTHEIADPCESCLYS